MHIAEKRDILKNEERKLSGSDSARRAGFQPAVSQCFQPAELQTFLQTVVFSLAADWKSAIQQVGTLRYAAATSLTQN
jgi:hypothetical protein